MVKNEQFLDDKGRKTRIKILIRKKYPMSKAGYDKWGHMQKIHISKSKFVWKPYVSSKDYFYKCFPPDGAIPIDYFVTDKALGDFILDFVTVSDGDLLGLQGFCHGKTRTGIKFTKHLATINIISVENRKFEIQKTQGLSRYWFRRELSKDYR